MEGIEEVLPDDVRSSAERSHGVEVGLCHPDAKRGILLAEGLSGGDGADARHRFRCGGRVDEDVLVVATFAGCGEMVADEFAEAELEETGEERGC